MNKHRILLVLQAMDTGGKDGCVKHVFSRIDPQGIHVRSFKKPTEEELARDFLWRVHEKVPRNGEMVIFNRSHYEDVIAVKVKKLFPDKVWKQRYQHIVDFERMLAEEGTTVVKIYLHISKDEQKRRIVSRLENPDKHWKFHPDDLKDRALWNDFMKTYEDLLSKTSTEHAPWYVVPANRKWYRNLCVARIMVDTMKRLNMKLPTVDWDPKKIVVED
jgi:PPK2 family polyphosphate:nucleotide phosphotransferase